MITIRHYREPGGRLRSQIWEEGVKLLQDTCSYKVVYCENLQKLTNNQLKLILKHLYVILILVCSNDDQPGAGWAHSEGLKLFISIKC